MSRSLLTRLRLHLHSLGVVILAVAMLLVASPVRAATATGTGLPASTQLDILQHVNAALVGLYAEAIPGARSIETLGETRAGSGVLISDDGLILTIGYLVLEAQSIEVLTQDGRRVPARSVAYDLATGFGLVRSLVPLRGTEPAVLGANAGASTGDKLLVGIGGIDGGIGMTQLVSKRAFSGYWEYFIESALFTSPPAPNHSGAGLFNLQGELLGIGSLYTNDAAGKGPRSLAGNVFVPVELLKPVLAEMQATGSTRASRRPWLGLSSGSLGGHLQVLRVTRESPAEAAGLRPGDVVLEIDGAKVATPKRSTSSSGPTRNPTPRSSSRCSRARRCARYACAPSTACRR